MRNLKEKLPEVLLGILMIIFGSNKFLDFIIVVPPEDPIAQAFLVNMFSSFLFKTVALTEIIGGILLLLPKLRFLGWLILAPVIFSIVVFHIAHDFIGNGIWLLPTVLFVWIGMNYRRPLFQLITTV